MSPEIWVGFVAVFVAGGANGSAGTLTGSGPPLKSLDRSVMSRRSLREIAVTSGTTGYPKGVVHAHDTALDTVQSTIDRQGITDTDVVHLALPVGHTFGYFYGVRCALQAGGTVLLQERWEPRRMAELARAHGITVSLGTTAFIIDLLNAGEDVRRALDGVWLFTQSGDALPGPVARRAHEELPFRISKALGMTEVGHVTSTDAAIIKALADLVESGVLTIR